MYNIEEFHAADFGYFLLKTHLVASGKEKLMVHWTRKFFGFRNQIPDMAWYAQLSLCLENLQASENYQERQVRQAEHAVRLYFCNYLTKKSSLSDHKTVFSRKPRNPLCRSTFLCSAASSIFSWATSRTAFLARVTPV